jgi:heme A synthase
MEPDRFDDVELQMIEEPEEPRGPRRATRWALGVVAAVLTAGAMAAGAWALTSSDDAPAVPAAKPSVHRVHGSDAAWRDVNAHPCGRKHRGESSSSATVRY